MKLHTLLLTLPLLLDCTVADAQTTAPPSRGALLYDTHCIGCHSTQMHWRDNKVARDWGSLKAQVRRWQGNNFLGWGDDDIDAVADHLNRQIYRYHKPVTPA